MRLAVLSGSVALAIAQMLSVSPPLFGLWELPAIQPDAAASAYAVIVHSEPSAVAPVIARLDAKGITLTGAATDSCTWRRDFELAAAPRGCLFTESGYEIPALAVFGRRGDWLRIALDDGATRFGWVRQRGEFHSLPDVLASGQLTYMTAAWDRTIYDSPRPASSNFPGRVARAARNGSEVRAETPYRPVGHRFVQDRLWLQVELLDEVCGAAEPKVVDAGWVPAQSPAGHQWAWFWSRGC